jgi:Flp pilus assembly pilin Flp
MASIQLLLNRRFAELHRLTTRQEGQALIEYVLIITLVALVTITALGSVGTSLNGALTHIAGAV